MNEIITEATSRRVMRQSRPKDYWPAIPEGSALNLEKDVHIRVLLGAAGLYISINVLEGRVTTEKLVEDLRISRLRDPSQRKVSALLDDHTALTQLSESILLYFADFPELPYYILYCKERGVTRGGLVQNDGILMFDAWVQFESQTYRRPHDIRLLKEFLQRHQTEELRYGDYIYKELPSLPEGSAVNFKIQLHFALLLAVAEKVQEFEDSQQELTKELIKNIRGRLEYEHKGRRRFVLLIQDFDNVFNGIVAYLTENPLLASYLVDLRKRGEIRERGYVKNKNVSAFLVWRARRILRQEYGVDLQYTVLPEDQPDLQRMGHERHREDEGRKGRSRARRGWEQRAEIEDRQ